MTKQISKEKLNIFVMAAKAFMDQTNNKKSKLWYAADKICKVAENKLKKVEMERDEKRREFALCDDKGVFDLNPQGGYKFDKEGLKKLKKALSDIDEETVDLPVHIIEQFDDTKFNFDMRNSFEGIIIPEIDYETFDIDSFKEEPEKVDDNK